MRTSGLALAAATLLALEGAALIVFALIEIVGLSTGEAVVLPTAIALIVLTLIGAAALIAFSVGTRRGQSWARSGGVVIQVLAAALAVASLALQPIPWLFVTAVGLPAVVCFALLIGATRAEHEQSAE